VKKNVKGILFIALILLLITIFIVIFQRSTSSPEPISNFTEVENTKDESDRQEKAASEEMDKVSQKEKKPITDEKDKEALSSNKEEAHLESIEYPKDPSKKNKNSTNKELNEEKQIEPPPSPSTEKLDQSLTYQEIMRLTDNKYTQFLQKFYEIGTKYNWDKNENPADKEIMKKELNPLITVNFFNTKIQPYDSFYCRCDVSVFLPIDIHARFQVLEQTENFIKVNTVSLATLIQGGQTIELGFKKTENDHWKLDSLQETHYFEQPLNLTWEEAKNWIEKEKGKSVTLVKEIYLTTSIGYDDSKKEFITDKVKHYLFKYEGESQLYTFSSYSGLLYEYTPEEAETDIESSE
jgi:hypothetical protein